MPAPLAPMIATVSPALDREVDAEQRLEVAVEGGRAHASRAAPVRPHTGDAQIDLAHLAAVHHRARVRPRDLLRPKLSTDEPVDDRQQRMHDMLDPDDRDARRVDLPDRRDQFAGIRPRSGRRRSRRAAAGAVASRARAPFRAACGRAKSATPRDGWPCRAGPSPRGLRRRHSTTSRLALAASEAGGDEQVLEHGQLPEGRRDLVRAADARRGSARARWRAVMSRPSRNDWPELGASAPEIRLNRVDLARPVRPDDAQRLALRDGERHAHRPR